MRLALIPIMLLATGCARAPLPTVLDEQFREVADIEAEVRETRRQIASIQADIAARRAALPPLSKPCPDCQGERAVGSRTDAGGIQSMLCRQCDGTGTVALSPWHCGECGHAIWIDWSLDPHHLDPSLNRSHIAKLSDADMKTIADGLRMSD